jgi:hypothetical protein
MANFKKTVATAKAKVAKAESLAFAARLEAIDAILQDASPHDVLMLCAHALADIDGGCCEAHHDEFKADLLQALASLSDHDDDIISLNTGRNSSSVSRRQLNQQR